MASRKTGSVTYTKDVSPTLTTFRVTPEKGGAFPAYNAGQYIALGRDDGRLTKKVGVGPDGRPLFAPDLDDTGRQRVGPVMHSYTIASAPWETAAQGFLEFYVVQEVMAGSVPGRLSTVLLGMPCCEDEPVNYVDRERAAAEAALGRTLRPALPAALNRVTVRSAAQAVILACGNPASTADIEWTAARAGIRSEVEPW